MGAGSSQEAEFDLLGDIRAGTWTLVADGIITESVDVTFELLVRRGGTDLPLASWDHHFDPRGGGNFDAVIYEDTAAVDEVVYEDGDQLIFRYSAGDTVAAMAYIPNGDGARQNGRIPHLILP